MYRPSTECYHSADTWCTKCFHIDTPIKTEQQPTPPLAEFLKKQKTNRHEWYYLIPGEMKILFDEAVSKIEDLQNRLRMWETSSAESGTVLISNDRYNELLRKNAAMECVVEDVKKALEHLSEE